jgi:hypothetical protein
VSDPRLFEKSFRPPNRRPTQIRGAHSNRAVGAAMVRRQPRGSDEPYGDKCSLLFMDCQTQLLNRQWLRPHRSVAC